MTSLALLALSVSSVPQAQECMRALRAIPVGSVVAKSDFASGVPCPQGAVSALRYEHAPFSIVARRSLAEGEVVRQVPEHLLANVSRGASIRLKEKSGPVTIERTVEAVQSGWAGRRIFVRTVDGAVFSAAIAEEK